MRSIIIVGPEVKLDLDYIRRETPEIEIMQNTLPDEGVAIYDCGKSIDWSWPNEVGVVGECSAIGRKTVTHLQGPDWSASVIAWINEGLLTQPPEEDESPGPAQE